MPQPGLFLDQPSHPPRSTTHCASTANGIISGWQIKLDSVSVGDVTIYGVDASITPAPMPYILLGNSFLSRFQMRQENGQMTLTKNY